MQGVFSCCGSAGGRRLLRAAAMAVAGMTAGAAGGGGATTGAASSSCPWIGSTAPTYQRVEEVMANMTLANEEDLVYGGAGSYVGNIEAIPSLCIPSINLQDGPLGVGDQLQGVTQMPGAVAAASTWDPSLEQQYGAVVGSEDAGKGVNVDLGPTINIVRDPRWGRAFESMSEDPYLAGQLGAAEIRGVQSQGVLAQVKHLGVYNQETNRNTPSDNAIIDPR